MSRKAGSLHSNRRVFPYHSEKRFSCTTYTRLNLTYVLTPMCTQGFRMLVGDQGARTPEKAEKYRQLTYTCLQDLYTRYPETKDFPSEPCPAGIMVNARFPT